MATEKIYTFKDLGFHDFIPILVPVRPDGAYRYTTMVFEKREKVVRDFMMEILIKYMRSSGKTDFTDEFFGGIAYMHDGSLITVYNGMNGQEDRIFFKTFDPEAYKSVNAPEGQEPADNVEYISALFNARIPKGLILIQELESPQPELYHFRVIHETDKDEVE